MEFANLSGSDRHPIAQEEPHDESEPGSRRGRDDPVLEQIAEASEGRVTLMKVNVDENPGLAARYGIRSIPTILFVKQATVVDRIVGAVPKAVVQDIVDARAS
jgi:hypothetical protein